MPLTGNVQGQFLNIDTSPAVGKVVFRPSASWLLNSALGATMYAVEIECPLDEGGFLTHPSTLDGVNLQATDDPDINPQDWTWTATVVTEEYVQEIPFELPAGDSVDLNAITPVAVSHGQFIVAGPPGGLPAASSAAVIAGTSNTDAVTPVGIANGLQIHVVEDSGVKALQFGDLDDQITVADGKYSRPKIGYFIIEGGIPKWQFAGAVAIPEIGDPAEWYWRRTSGDTATRTVAITTLDVAVADITVASSITCDDLSSATDAWTDTGTIIVQDASGSGTAVLTYSTINRATGVLGGLSLIRQSQTAFDIGDTVFLALTEGTTIGLGYGQADSGRGAFQERVAAQRIELAETHSPDGYGGTYNGGRWVWGTSSLGPGSARNFDRMYLTEQGYFGLTGSWALTVDDIDRPFLIAARHTNLSAGITLPQASIPVDDPTGFPTSGSVVIGANTVTFTGWSASSGQWYLTGCSGGSGSVSSGANVQLAKNSVGVVGGFMGDIVVRDFGDNEAVKIGLVGSSLLAGVQFGNSGPSLYRNSNSEVGSAAALFVQRASGAAGVRVGADTDTTNARLEMRPGGLAAGPGGGTAIDILWKRLSSTEWGARNIADNADIGIRASQFRLLSGGPTITSGSGTPEGSVTAVVGSHYHRTDGGAATSFYVKESGSGNTGWVAK
jgi:hypothetical protein